MNDFTKEELKLILFYHPHGNDSLCKKVRDMIDNYCEHEKHSLEERVSGLEQWAINHDIEGIEYGKEFEERDFNIINRIERIERLLNIKGDE